MAAIPQISLGLRTLYLYYAELYIFLLYSFSVIVFANITGGAAAKRMRLELHARPRTFTCPLY